MRLGADRNIWRKREFRDRGNGLGRTFGAISRHFHNCMKWSRQRVVRGYCDRDIWDMYSYLQSLIPDMLYNLKVTRNGSPGFLGENYVNDEGILVNDTCHEEWDRILDRMIFLWHESDETACSMENEYEEEYMRAFDDFEDRYGLLGEKLSEGEPAETCGRRVHFMSEVDEYKEISDKYRLREEEIDKYREECKDEAMDMLKKYFFSLWD